MFIEVCFRIAKLIYASNEKVDKYGEPEDDYNGKYKVKMSNAFEIFYKYVLLKFKD